MNSRWLLVVLVLGEACGPAPNRDPVKAVVIADDVPRFWAAFDEGTGLTRWLYNQGKDPNRPGDLGYFIGYRVAQAYAKKLGDDSRAVQQLVRAKNLEQLVIDSGYDGTPP